MKFTVDMSKMHVSIRANEGLAQITWFHQMRPEDPQNPTLSWVNLYVNFTLRIHKKPLYHMQDNPFKRIQFIKSTIGKHVPDCFEVSFMQFHVNPHLHVVEYIADQRSIDRIISCVGERITHYINSNL